MPKLQKNQTLLSTLTQQPQPITIISPHKPTTKPTHKSTPSKSSTHAPISFHDLINPNLNLNPNTDSFSTSTSTFSQHLSSNIIPSILQTQISLSAQNFVYLFKNTLLNVSQHNIVQVCQVYMHLVNHNYDQDQVISQMKKCKDIDAVYVLIILWKYMYGLEGDIGKQGKQGKEGNNNKSSAASSYKQKLSNIIKIINLILICYPVDLMIHGGQYIKRWNQKIKQEIQLQNYIRKISNKVNTSQVKLFGYNVQKFIDVYIPL